MRTILIIIIFSVITQYSKAQDTSQLVAPWKEVKIWLLKRAQLTKKLVTALNKKIDFAKGLPTRPENIADTLVFQINSFSIPDSVSIRKIDLINNRLTSALEPYINFLNINPKLKYKINFLELQVQLEASENRLEAMASEFNKKAIDLRRKDMCFILLGTSEPPIVKFE
ncbi:hypothetical protein EZJ43_16975 [Pedobacter changchengzhani]|uniref:LemA family protein n=1 Tax=Pedobacter changchengzhani TaxID=2529274 RepID=A0A4R5MGY1_9SPHI|nr:LemA family protein [Pedobacter changchengzhani]TDG34764.1 hypothetical protein EZJ43_16975 [Pedobacter changchengzhani]